MRKYLLLLLLVSGLGFSQSINQYKYIIIPAKFSAQNSAGQFGLNNLTKMFLEKNGYTAYFDTDVLPTSVATESCKLFIDVQEDNSMFTTKLRVVIKDCRNAVLFTSEYGKSSEKDNHVAYNKALREAFKSFDKPEYRYNPKVSTVAVAEVKPYKETTETVVVAENFNNDAVNAQVIENGFQLVDTTPKVVLKIYKTSVPEVFIAEDGALKGILIKKAGQWVFEYYENNRLVSKSMNIKF